MTDKMKCAFCEWTTKRWTMRDGKRINGHTRLAHHVETAHHDEYVKIMSRLEETEEDRLRRYAIENEQYVP